MTDFVPAGPIYSLSAIDFLPIMCNNYSDITKEKGREIIYDPVQNT